MSPETMDFLYFYRKTDDDFELRYSLRSIERYAPWTRKVWIYGACPDFLTKDTSVAEHVPDSFAAAVLGIQPPVKNFFQMLFLTSLIPELTPEYVWCSDDHFLLRDYTIEDARRVRYLENLRDITSPTRKGLWKSQLWRTFDGMVQLGYPAYNFETHTPIYFTKRRVINAFCAMRDFVTSDRWYGLMGASSILNHAHKTEGMPIFSIREEASRAGWGGKIDLSYDDVVRDTDGKLYLFLGDGALTEATREFLMTRFPDRSRYEADEPAPETTPSQRPSQTPPAPEPAPDPDAQGSGAAER